MHKKFEKQLNELKVPYFNVRKIEDSKTIEEYTNQVISGKGLPSNISFKAKLVPRDLEAEYLKQYRIDKTLPEDVNLIKRQKEDGIVVLSLEYNNQFDFNVTEYFTKEELDFSLKLKQTKDNQTIANALQYFKILSIVTIVLSFIAILIGIGNA